MELAIGALELQNSLYFSLFAGNCVGDRFAGDCFHHHLFSLRAAAWLSGDIPSLNLGPRQQPIVTHRLSLYDFSGDWGISCPK